MGKKRPSWKEHGETQEERLEDFQRAQDAASRQSMMVGVCVACFFVLAAAGYQYSLAVVAENSAATTANTRVEGVHQDKNGFTSLHRAAEQGVEAVRALMPEQQKAINVTDKWNETPVMKAARKGLHTTVRYLLEQTADPNVMNTEGRTALYHALFNDKGNETAIELLKFGADVNVSLKSDRSLLHVACSKGEPEAAAFLIANQVDLTRTEASTGRTALHSAVALSDGKKAEQLTGLLLNAGAAANTKDSENGATPLHDAVTTGHVEVVKVLLEHGADPSVEDDMLRRTPLTLAKKKKKDDVMKVLEEFLAQRAAA